MRSTKLCDITSPAASGCEDAIIKFCYIISSQPSKGANDWLGRTGADCAVRLVYPKAFAHHPTQHPFNSPRSEHHDKCEPCNDDPSSGFRGTGPCCNFLGAAAPTNCRADRQDVWPRFVREHRSHPLHVECTVP